MHLSTNPDDCPRISVSTYQRINSKIDFSLPRDMNTKINTYIYIYYIYNIYKYKIKIRQFSKMRKHK